MGTLLFNIFSAVTSNGMLFFWYLWQDKQLNLITQRAFKNQEALHLIFNYEDRIVLVGHDHGGLNYFKLSDSLIKRPLVHKPAKGELKAIGEKYVTSASYKLKLDNMDKFLDSLDK